MINRMPLTTPGMSIGLLGGSFDPPHAGHLHISRWALRRLRLDRVWWLVSPGNPLKANPPKPLAQRMAACRDVAAHPRIDVTDVETHLGTRYTADTIAGIMKHKPGVGFVWLMGADNLAQFHEWDRWNWIMETLPIGVMARPREQIAAGLSVAAERYARNRLHHRRAAALRFRQAPCWTLLTGKTIDISSSQIRARGDWT